MKTLFDANQQGFSMNWKKPVGLALFIMVWILIDKGNAAGQSSSFISSDSKKRTAIDPSNSQPQFKTGIEGSETPDDGSGETPDEFVVYPNPVEDELVFDFEFQVKTGIPFEVLDALGRRMDIGTFKSGLNTQRLDFSKYRSGLYLIRVSLGSTTVVKRVIKK